MLTVKRQKIGVLTNGDKVHLYTVSNGKMSFTVMDYGCTITGIYLPDKNGGRVDVLLGHSMLPDYVNSSLCFGSIVGRFANRIGGARFSLDGAEYKLDKNDNKVNTLHGGFFRQDHLVWASEAVSTEDGTGVRLTRRSPDMEQGFPGNLDVSVTYTLNEANALVCRYEAVTDKATPVNWTNHAYFNLAGRGTVLNHLLQSDCRGYLEVDANLIPTGKIIEVAGTPFDFTTEKPIGREIDKVGAGYDHCYVTPAYNGKDSGLPLDASRLVRAAVLTDPESGRRMTMDTNQEGVQIYTANWIGGVVGKSAAVYEGHGAVCLESQCFPDTPNKKEFPPCILRPGQKYDAVTVYGFEF